MVDRSGDMRLVAEGRNAGFDGRAIDVERPADPVQRIGHVGRRIAPAEPQHRQPVDLRERARHHDVVAGRDELDAGGVIVAPHIFGIGSIEHQKHVRRQARVKALHLLEGQVGSGRVVGVREEDDLGAGRHAGEDRVDVRREVGLPGDHGHAAGCKQRELVHQEAMLGVDALVPRPDIGIGEHREDFVGPAAADDARRIEAVARADGLAQGGRAAVGIEFKLARELAVGGDRLRRRAERRLVGGELVDLGDRRGAPLLPGT